MAALENSETQQLQLDSYYQFVKSDIDKAVFQMYDAFNIQKTQGSIYAQWQSTNPHEGTLIRLIM